MTIHVRPDLAAILEQQVAAGNFKSVEDALEAAILTLAEEPAEDEDLSWAKPLIEEAEREIEAGNTVFHDEVWSKLKQRFEKT